MATQNNLNKISEGFTSTGGIDISGGIVSINSANDTFDIATDAQDTTVNIATGAAVKLATLGSTIDASSLDLQFGTAGQTLASATGTVMATLDTGEINYGLTPAFYAYLTANQTNVTGDGTVYSPVLLDGEIFDQGANFATSTFTAPVTGKYQLTAKTATNGAVTFTTYFANIVTSNRSILFSSTTSAIRETGGSAATPSIGSVLVDMDAADTAFISVQINGGTLTVAVLGSALGIQTFFMGKLIC